MITHEQLLEVRVLLREGKPQEAADLLQKLENEDADAAGAAAAKLAEPPPQRAPEVILHDFMVAVADRMGNHAVLEQLAAEFEAVTASPKKA